MAEIISGVGWDREQAGLSVSVKETKKRSSQVFVMSHFLLFSILPLVSSCPNE